MTGVLVMILLAPLHAWAQVGPSEKLGERAPAADPVQQVEPAHSGEPGIVRQSDGNHQGSVNATHLGRLTRALREAGCPAYEVRKLEARWFAACGEHGVWVLESVPAGTINYPASVLFVVDEQSYRLVHRERLAFAVVGIDESFVAKLQYSQPVARAQTSAVRTEHAIGEVVRFESSVAVVRWRTQRHAALGTQVRIDSANGGVTGTILKKNDVEFQIQFAHDRRRPKLGSLVFLAPALAEERLNVPNVPEYHFGFGGRGIFGIDGRGGGLISGGDVSFSARFRGFRVLAEGAPLIYSRAASTMSATVAAGYASKRYGLEVVGGASYINYDPPNIPGMAAVWGLAGRYGHEDGLHVRLRGLVGWHVSHVLLADVRVGVQLPVSRRVAIEIDGYHGRIGRSGLELGLRGLAVGTGGAKSLFLLGSLGALLTFTSKTGFSVDAYPDAWALGPIFSFGALYRL